jgi:FemAB-related protein (PEP-CTERM system-associated)
MKVERLEENDLRGEGAWDAFVRTAPDATVFHLIAWKRVVRDVFRHRPHYLLAMEQGEVRGVLPLFEIHGLVSGHVLVSVPYGVYGGLCGSDPEARNVLLNAARELGVRQGVKHIELRQLWNPEPSLPTKRTYVSFRRTLSADPEANMSVIPGKQRRWVRKGINHGLETRRGWENLPAFYDVYNRNMRRLGSPAFPCRVFNAINEQFGKDAELLTIWSNGRLIGGVQSFFFRDVVMPYYASASEDAFSMGVNDFMYWDLTRQSGLDGFKTFDFSRSREGSGSYRFKCHWGFEPEPLAYQYILIKGDRIPDVSPSNPRLKGFIEIWKRLPVPLTRWCGPALTRWLPVD